jgi:argininosuccinate lyase
MFFRDALFREQAALRRLIRALVDRSGPVVEAVAPFYHHMQHAGRTTLGEYLLSWATYYYRHLDWIAQADKHLDIAPPPNCGRDIVIELVRRVGQRMGLSKSAQLWQTLLIAEEQFSDPMFVFVQINVALARLSYDLLIWMTSEFDFFELADEHASVSSGRPQKKNPFGFQTIISGASVGAGRLAAQLTTSVTMSEELNSTFHASSLYQYAEDVVAWTEFMADVIEKCSFNIAELERKSSLGGAGAREALDILVYEHKVPYRFAHHSLGALIRTSRETSEHSILVDVLKTRLKDYPNLDCDDLVRTSLALNSDHMMLNLAAFRDAQRQLEQNLRGLDVSRRHNPTEEVVRLLTAEAEQFVMRGKQSQL